MLVILSIMFCSCDEPLSQLEATDNEAIYNVILVDNYRVGDLEIIPSDIPDTTSYIENPDTANILYWHKIEQKPRRTLISLFLISQSKPRWVHFIKRKQLI